MEPLTLADRFRSGAPESAKTRSILTRRARRPSDTDKPTCDVMLLEEEAKMLRTLAYATLFSAALIGPGAYGADDAAAPKDQPPQAQAPSGVNFVMRQEKSQWRAPKLVGVGVYGPDDKQVGKIDDLRDPNCGYRGWRIPRVRKEGGRSAVRGVAMAHGKPEGPRERSAAD